MKTQAEARSPATEEEFWEWVGKMARRTHRKAVRLSPSLAEMLEPGDLVSEAAVGVLEEGDTTVALRLVAARRAMWEAVRYWMFGKRRNRDVVELRPPVFEDVDGPSAVWLTDPAATPLEVCEQREGGAVFYRARQLGVLTANQTVVLRGHLWDGKAFGTIRGVTRASEHQAFVSGLENMRKMLGVTVEKPRDRRRELVLRAVAEGRSAAEAGRLYGVSRATAQRWAREVH